MAEIRRMGQVYAEAIRKIGQVVHQTGEAMNNAAKAFAAAFDIMRGIPRQPTRALSPFEQSLFDLERDRCRRLSELQDRLLDVRY